MRPSAVCTRDGYLRPLTSALILAETPDDWSQGIPLVYVQEVADCWLETYDMNRVADRLNAYPQFTTTLDGVEVHMLHARSSNPNAKPLIITQGWPGSVMEFLKVIGPLTEPQEHGGNAEDAFHVALQDPEHCKGIHLNMVFAPPSAELMEDLTKLEQSALAGMQHYQDWDSGYSKQQSTRPQTVGYGLVDSPVGQMAWILEKFWAWTDCDGRPENVLTRDEMLDNVMVHWLNAAGASSARLYWESFGSGGAGDVIVTPMGDSIFPKEILRTSRRWAEARFTTSCTGMS